MGKNLKGRELGIGISQRKDGLYTARFTDKLKKRHQKYFKTLQECRQWLADEQFKYEHGDISVSGDITVSAWFDYWINNIKNASYRKNTVNSYKNIFNRNIKPYIGNMLLKEVKPLHCQNVINQMISHGYKNSTIQLVRTAMKSIFEDAVENEIIIRNPVIRMVRSTQGKDSSKKTALTKDEQNLILKYAAKCSYFYQYALILQTGIRTGELSGLKWSDIDFEKKVMYISRTANIINGEWVIGTTKSKSGTRSIPLTNDAINILNSIKTNKKSPKITQMQYHDFIFISRNGIPIDNSSYNKALRNICDKANMRHISMHTLRHTFATRCIEAGMRPKTLQTILGHSSIDVTMNIYVHVMDDIKNEEMKNVEAALKII